MLRGVAQRRFDRVKRSANQDHVCHRRFIAFVFTTVPRDFRIGGRFGGFNYDTYLVPLVGE